MANISKGELLGKVLQGLADGGWTPVAVEDRHPFLVRAVGADGSGFNLRVYIWNCTPGGRNRAADEFRIQTTIGELAARPGEITALLGWYDELGVFAAWDIDAHAGPVAESPSCQVKLGTLEAARERSFATQRKDNEMVVAFEPFLLADYALARASLHATGAAERDLSLLNRLGGLRESEIEQVRHEERRTIIRTIAAKFRAHQFRSRVLGAYEHQCAFCGVQLALVDAAHIVPVSAPESTDEVVNGVALCKLHHFAYDSNLVSFDERYSIATSHHRTAELGDMGLLGGWEPFCNALRPALILPRDGRLYPNVGYISLSRRLRGWRA